MLFLNETPVEWPVSAFFQAKCSVDDIPLHLSNIKVFVFSMVNINLNAD